jgi:hypothetical protein
VWCLRGVPDGGRSLDFVWSVAVGEKVLTGADHVGVER